VKGNNPSPREAPDLDTALLQVGKL